MTRVIWTRQAVEDVEAIKAHVARDSERYAGLLVERLVAAVGRLELFPQSGRVGPEVGDGSLREVIYGNYRLVYRLQAESVEVVTICMATRPDFCERRALTEFVIRRPLARRPRWAREGGAGAVSVSGRAHPVVGPLELFDERDNVQAL